MKRFIFNNIPIILVLTLFLITRIYKINTIPSSVYWDEASIGYNAYSILKTGKDEWGEFMPLHFRAFGEFKLPVYVYTTIPFVYFFGLNELSVRLPSVLFGVLSVVGLYLIVKKISKSKTVAFLSALIFSLTPWYFLFSRTGYEAVAGLCLFIYGLYFYLISKDRKIFLLVSVFSFIASIYSYNSFRILSPLVLSVIFLDHLRIKNYKYLFISVLIFIASLLPIYKLYKSDSGLSRFSAVGSQSNLLINYFKNFSVEYLFIKGDNNPRSQVPNNPQLYFIDVLFLTMGIVYVLKSRKYYGLLALLLVAPIPAMITKENPHSLRAILMSPLLSIVSAFGIYYLSQIAKKYSKFIILLSTVIYLVLFSRYFINFVSNYNLISSSSWQLEYKNIFQNTKAGCVDDEYAQPYIFALFYGRDDNGEIYHPRYFIETKKLNDVSDWGFSTVRSFGEYVFEKKCI